MIRTFQGFLKLLLTAAIIAGGAVLYFYPTSAIWEFYASNVPQIQDHDLYRQIGGAALAVLGILALLPRLPKRKKDREISFVGTHGEVTIALEPVEATLERVASKLPEVRSISIRLKPLEAQGSVRVIATAILRKDAESDIRLLTARVCSYIETHTTKILGTPDVNVKLKLKKLEMIMKTVKPEPLLLEAPEYESPRMHEAVVEARATSTAYRPSFETVSKDSAKDEDLPEVETAEDDELTLDRDEERAS